MEQQLVRPAAVAGSWYPASADALRRTVDRYLAEVSLVPRGTIRALIAPHAGLIYSGPVAAHAYRAVQGHQYDVAVLVGPSHYVSFEGVAVLDQGVCATPLGPIPVSRVHAQAIQSASPLVEPRRAVHAREHSLEMQFPFLKRVLGDTPIVPLVMGTQTRRTIVGLADGLASAFCGVRALLIASTDLSHFCDGTTAARLDGRVVALVEQFDADGLLAEFERYPVGEQGRFVACGGGPAIAVMRAARALGATEARVLKYADSGDVSGDKSAVVGYLAAALGTFEAVPPM